MKHAEGSTTLGGQVSIIAFLSLACVLFTCGMFAAESVRAEEETPQAQVGFSGMATLDIQVRDRTEALEWFSKVLGLEHLFTAEELNWAEVRSPVANLTIGIEEVRDRPIRTSSIDFGVRDIVATRTILESRGATFLGPTEDYGPVLIARISDPSGNLFNLFQGK